jgi:serine/threonine protein kinase
LTALCTLKHPNIVKLYEYGINGKIKSEHGDIEDVWYLVLEYISERTLVDFIVSYGGVMEEYARYFFK